MIGVGVVGCGYWGPNLVRNFATRDDCQVRVLCDTNPEALDKLHRRFPAARAVVDFAELLRDPEVQAVAVATPIDTHYALARAALEAGRHVLVEKPFTASTAEAEALVELADARRLVLQVDHPFVYSGAIQKIRSMIDARELGDLLYLDSVRVNLGIFQPNVNVLWDLAPHDLSIMDYLIDERPVWVSAVGSAHYGQHENLAYLTLRFEGALIAHLHLNWLAPVKIRSTLIGGSERMVVYDDLAAGEQLRVYDKGVTLQSDPDTRARALVDYRVGDMFAPHIERTEPLAQVCRDFIQAIATGGKPLTDGQAGLRVVRILDAAQRSLRKDGERIAL